MDEYRLHISQCAAQEGSSETIFNRSPEHAAIIIEYLFAVAQEEVDVLTGSLNASVYGTPGVVKNASNFVGRGKIRILVEDQSQFLGLSHPVLEKLVRDGTIDRVQIRFVPEDIQQRYSYHFAVVDGESYRMEGDRGDYQAIAAFRDRDFSGKLLQRFNELWELCGKRA